MKHDLPTVNHPTDPKSIYFQVMYREWFFGPFKDEAELTDAVLKLDKIEPQWDYDGYRVIYGADPLPKSYRDLVRVGYDLRDRLEKARKVP